MEKRKEKKKNIREEERSRMPRGGYGDISTHTGVTGGADLTGSSCEAAGLS